MCCYMLSVRRVFFLVFYRAVVALVLAPISALLSLKTDGHRQDLKPHPHPHPLLSLGCKCVCGVWCVCERESALT